MRKYKHIVQYYETDRMGITHIDFLDQIGWNYARLEELGVISPVTEASCRYKHSTTFADEILISVSVEEFKGVRLKLRYRMEKADGSLAAEGHSEHCFLDPDGKIVRLDKRFPDFFRTLTELAQANEPQAGGHRLQVSRPENTKTDTNRDKRKRRWRYC